MNITPLSAARIAGEVGLAGGTITGGAYAAKYSGQVSVEKKDRGSLRTVAHEMSDQIKTIHTAWYGISNCTESQCIQNNMSTYQMKLKQAIDDAKKSSDNYSKVIGAMDGNISG